jgi:hypothetical protein
VLAGWGSDGTDAARIVLLTLGMLVLCGGAREGAGC